MDEKQVTVSRIRSADKQTLLKKIYEMDGIKVSVEEQRNCLEGLAYLVNVGEDFSKEEYTEMFHGLARTFYNKNITIECVLLSLSILTSIIKEVEEAFFISTTLETIKKKFPECTPYAIRLQSMICEPDSKFLSSLCAQCLNNSISISSSAMFSIGYLVYNHQCSSSSFSEKDLIKIIEKKKEWNYGLAYIVDVLLENCVSSKDINKIGRIVASILPNDNSIQKNWDINPFFVQKIVECVGSATMGKSSLSGNFVKLPQNLNNLLNLALSMRPKVVSSNGSRYILPATRYAVLRHMLVSRDISLTQKSVLDSLPDALGDLETTPPGRYVLADILSDTMSVPIIGNNINTQGSSMGISSTGSSSSSSSSSSNHMGMLGTTDGINGSVSGILLQIMKRLVHDSHPQTACLALNALISASALKPQSSITENVEMKNNRVLVRDALLEALHSEDVCRRVSTMSESMKRRMVDACHYMVDEYVASGAFNTADNTLGDIIGIIDIILNADNNINADSALTTTAVKVSGSQGSSIISRNILNTEPQNYINTRRCLDVLLTVVRVYVKFLSGSLTVGSIPSSLSNVASIINHVSRIIYRCVEENSGNELNRLAMYLRDLCVETASLATIIRDLDKVQFTNPEIIQLYNSLLHPISCLMRSSAICDGAFYGSPFTIPIETLPNNPIFEEIFGKKTIEISDENIIDFEKLIKKTEERLNESYDNKNPEGVSVSEFELPMCDLSSIISNAGTGSAGQQTFSPKFIDDKKKMSPESKVSTDEINRKIASELISESSLPSFLSEKIEKLEEYFTSKEEIPLNADSNPTDEDVVIKHVFHWRRSGEKLYVILEAILTHSVDAKLDCRLEYRNENMKVQSTIASLDCNEEGHLFTYIGEISEDDALNLDCLFLYKEIDWDAISVGCLRISVSSFMKESQFLQLNKSIYDKFIKTEFVLENYSDTRSAAMGISSLLRLGVNASSVDSEDVLTCVLAGIYTPTQDAIFVILTLKTVDVPTKKKSKKQIKKQAVHVELEARSQLEEFNNRIIREITGE